MNIPSCIVAPERDQIFRMDGYYVWGASVLKDDDGLYHMYACRWPASPRDRVALRPPGLGWLSHAEIVRAVSDRVQGPYEYAETLNVFKEEDWAKDSAIGPNAFEHKGTYYITYTAMRLPERTDPDEPYDVWRHRNRHVIRFNQHIGLVSAPHPAGPWTPVPANPILGPRVGEWDESFVTTSTIRFTPEGKALMLYKSSTEKHKDLPLNVQGELMFGMAIADHPEGPYERIGPEPLFDADVEDACFWHEGGRWWMMCKDMTGRIGGDRYGAGVLYTSPDALHWEEAENIVAWTMWIDWSDGERQPVYKMEKPMMYFEGGRPVCLFTPVMPSETEETSWNLARLLSM